MEDVGTVEQIRHMSSKTLENLLHQMKLDPIKFESDIEEIEQELLIRTLNFCKPVIDLI